MKTTFLALAAVGSFANVLDGLLPDLYIEYPQFVWIEDGRAAAGPLPVLVPPTKGLFRLKPRPIASPRWAVTPSRRVAANDGPIDRGSDEAEGPARDAGNPIIVDKGVIGENGVSKTFDPNTITEDDVYHTSGTPNFNSDFFKGTIQDQTKETPIYQNNLAQNRMGIWSFPDGSQLDLSSQTYSQQKNYQMPEYMRDAYRAVKNNQGSTYQGPGPQYEGNRKIVMPYNQGQHNQFVFPAP